MSNSDLTGKTMDGIVNQELIHWDCKCNKQTFLPNGHCHYDNKCRKAMIMYQLQCKISGKSYIRKTQRYFKKHTGEHFIDGWKVVETGRAKYSDQWYGRGGYQCVDAFAKNLSNTVETVTTTTR